jgi:hypothetical protein
MQYSNPGLLFECPEAFSFFHLQKSFFLSRTFADIVFGMRQVVLGFINQFGAWSVRVLALRSLVRERSSVLYV